MIKAWNSQYIIFTHQEWILDVEPWNTILRRDMTSFVFSHYKSNKGWKWSCLSLKKNHENCHPQKQNIFLSIKCWKMASIPPSTWTSNQQLHTGQSKCFTDVNKPLLCFDDFSVVLALYCHPLVTSKTYQVTRWSGRGEAVLLPFRH